MWRLPGHGRRRPTQLVSRWLYLKLPQIRIPLQTRKRNRLPNIEKQEGVQLSSIFAGDRRQESRTIWSKDAIRVVSTAASANFPFYCCCHFFSTTYHKGVLKL